MKIKFKKVASLSGDEEEVFSVKLTPKGSYSQKSYLNFKALNTIENYEIKYDTDSENDHSVKIKRMK